MKVFDKYSQYYDLIYRDKNYPEEVRFVEKILKKFSKKKTTNIISLGCGSGNHDIILAKKGYRIFGIDKSETMLSIFQEKIVKSGLKGKISLAKADVAKFKTPHKFDCALSLFNVVGYQTENESFEGMLKSINRSLTKGGLLMFDCWHAPAVLKDKPTDRVKEINVGERKIIRITKSELDITKNIIAITFKVLEIVNSKIKEAITETHLMRYWSIPELTYFLGKSGFRIEKVCNFLNLKSSASDDKWDIFIVARKIK